MFHTQRGLSPATAPFGVAEGGQADDLPGHSGTKGTAVDISRSLFETLKNLCRILEAAHVDYCLIGGLAVGILAKPRATEDIDLLILIDEQQIPSLMALLKKHLDVTHEGHVMHFPQATIWRTLIGTPAGDTVVVDFLLANHEVYREAVLNPIKLAVDDVSIPVANRELLIKIKELSGRPQDLLDITSLKEQ